MPAKLWVCAVALGCFSTLVWGAGGGSPLIDAAARGDIKTVRSLLANKAEVNAAGPDGSTALHQAVRFDHLDIVDLLLSAGTDVKAATRYKVTPVSLACSNGNAA